MKKVFLFLLAGALVTTAFFAFRPASSPNAPALGIGDAAPMTTVKMQGIDNKEYSIADVADENGVLVIFSCNTCPFVIAWEDRYNEVAAAAAKHNIGVIVLNSNEAKRNGADSKDAMKSHAEEVGYDGFPYVVDENHQLADAFGATRTPDIFLFDGDMQLVYKGAIDDSGGRGTMKEDYLINAMNNLVAGKPINPSHTKAIGCSIKRLN